MIARLYVVLIPLPSCGRPHQQQRLVSLQGGGPAPGSGVRWKQPSTARRPKSSSWTSGRPKVALILPSISTGWDLSWILNTSTLVKKTHHRLFFLRRLKKVHLSPPILANFYRCTVESILTNCITMATAPSQIGKHCRGRGKLPNPSTRHHQGHLSPCSHRRFALLPHGRRYRNSPFQDQQAHEQLLCVAPKNWKNPALDCIRLHPLYYIWRITVILHLNGHVLKSNGIIIDNLSALWPQLSWISTGLRVVFFLPAACEVLLYHPVSVSSSRRVLFIQMDQRLDHHIFLSQIRLLISLTSSGLKKTNSGEVYGLVSSSHTIQPWDKGKTRQLNTECKCKTITQTIS